MQTNEHMFSVANLTIKIAIKNKIHKRDKLAQLVRMV